MVISHMSISYEICGTESVFNWTFINSFINKTLHIWWLKTVLAVKLTLSLAPSRAFDHHDLLVAHYTGDICPAGFYCEEGSDWPTPCPQGTYSDQTGLRNVTDCFLCDGGEFCASYNLTEPTGNCTRGK